MNGESSLHGKPTAVIPASGARKPELGEVGDTGSVLAETGGRQTTM